MDTSIAQKIARAFVHGLAFAKGMTTLAQDAKAKMEDSNAKRAEREIENKMIEFITERFTVVS